MGAGETKYREVRIRGMKNKPKEKRCSNCVFYQEFGISTGVCNKHIKTFRNYKTGNYEMCLNIKVRSTWMCDDFVIDEK
jgi:hypothetical protein